MRSDVASPADLASHEVWGETVPLGWILLLGALGVLMAVAATRLFQDLQVVRPERGPAAPGASAADLSSAPIAPPAVVATPASAPAPVKDSKPKCPDDLAIYFPVGQAVPEDKIMSSDFAAVVDWAHQHPQARVAVEGHTDVVGQDQSNLLLSYKRAKAVAALLSERGLSPQQIQLAAAGSHAPIDGVPGDARANRRVTVRISDPDGCQTASR